MYKKINDSKEEKAFDEILRYSSFKGTDIIDVTGSERMGYLYLKRWVEEGRVIRYPFNLYSPVNPATAKPKMNLHEAVCQLEENAYLCELSAARFHGLIVPEDNCIYLASNKRFREVVYEGWTIKYKRYSEQEACAVSGLARYSSYTQTIMDLINAFPKCMTWEAFLVFLRNTGPLACHRVLTILKGVDNRNLNKKVGWLVDVGLLKVDDPSALMAYCIRHISKTKLVLCHCTEESGVYNEKWKLISPLLTNTNI
ncbi:hypothetical protein [Fusibacter tunisiensis]|uniref:Transcriptional regulator of viral defense system n=1 Tax=Fusibacter tunisiensis TaxID=1008308 RepID=A0ABS2MNB8_9FIRM|nr:hypothetical protein [Fusibacter tunisiensis]MBM7560885.1 putative transcriptional regulator of viral defense system [Fusibacter tunisiensis]